MNEKLRKAAYKLAKGMIQDKVKFDYMVRTLQIHFPSLADQEIYDLIEQAINEVEA